MKHKEIYVFLLISIIFLASCKNESKKNEIKETKSTETYPKEPITGFLFFKKGMSYSDVIEELNKRNIKFKEGQGTFVFNDVNIKSYNSYQNNLKIKVIKGEPLKILDNNIKDFELDFINDSLVKFKHYSEAIEELGENGYAENFSLIYNLRDALKEKYGPPTKAIGALPPKFEEKSSLHFVNNETTCFDDLLLREWRDKKTQVCISIKNLEHHLSNNKPFYMISQRSIFEIMVTYDESLIKKVKNAYREQMILQQQQQDKSAIKAREQQLKEL